MTHRLVFFIQMVHSGATLRPIRETVHLYLGYVHYVTKFNMAAYLSESLILK